MPNPLRTTPLANTYYNTLINPSIVIYFNYKKDSYFTLSCLKLNNIGNIKKIKKEEMSNKLGKEEP